MNRLSIRMATPDDAANIARIHVAAWRRAYRGIMSDERLAAQNVSDRTRRWREELQDGKTPCYVVMLDEIPAGFMHLSGSRDPDRDPQITGEINRLYIDPDYWRRGLGTALMQHALTLLAEQGFTGVDLWVLEDHVMARRFYEQLGFRPDGNRKPTRRGDLMEIRYSRSLDDQAD